jgi:2'-5' RNA ligase
MKNLYSALRLISNELGFDAADKPFRPHITLLRNSRAAAFEEIKPLSWKVDNYYLIESVQTGAGDENRNVEEFALADEKKESQF